MSQQSSDGIRARIVPREADIGDFIVRRALPYREVRSVGPWVFFDHMGPAELPPGRGIDVIPHPHINLATVTYLFDGEIVHRDSIGSVQTIRPGAINLMVAGSGIAHSERTPDELRPTGYTAHGLQLWMGLPEEYEETEPGFFHYPADALPERRADNAHVRVLMGEAYDLRSPVTTYSPTLYLEATLGAGGRLPLPQGSSECACYVVSGRPRYGTRELQSATMNVFAAGETGELRADDECRLVIIGGEPIGKRFMWWNFVSSRPDRIEQAKRDWKNRRFAAIPGDTEEYAPLPESDAHSRMK
jgi:redox-sensitive bicupin YhaK (pirin superfamily)